MPRPSQTRFEIVAAAEAVRKTGLPLDELAAVDGVQRLVRRFGDGRSESALRLPVPLVPEPPPTRIGVCGWCRGEFDSTGSTLRYCSAGCRVAANRAKKCRG